MSSTGGRTPEQRARENIDIALESAGWVIQDRLEMNLSDGQGVAVREFPLANGHGIADYLLFVDRKAVGVLEAKPAGFTLTGVEFQVQKYAEGLPDCIDTPVRPLPFQYMSTGKVTRFSNLLDPDPRSREIFRIHRPSTLAEWIEARTLDEWVKGLHAEGLGLHTAADETRPSTFRSRIQTLVPIEAGDAFSRELYSNQVEAINYLEQSLKCNHPRALIQMATGSGKTKMAIAAVYRLIKYGGARRILFLVDRSNLGEQAEKEFQGFRSPEENRKFTELYNVERLTSNHIQESSKVVITTIQRLYSMLQGEPDLNPEEEQCSLFANDQERDAKDPLPVVYNRTYPPEYFDVVIVDECHRSIYTLWRQVLEYFDSFIIGLTATPAKHTYGFFNRNVVMQYRHERAVADGVNVDFEVYRIQTKITKEGSTIEAGNGAMVGYRSRDTRELRWSRVDQQISYTGDDLDRAVVAKDQIRLIVKTFRDRLFTEIFPGRTEVPKTLVFAKDDSHAEDIVDIFREEFGRGNTFCQKITYKATGDKPSDLIQNFRNSYDPRIAVTVDMIATGTDIKPIEIVMFMRVVQSRILFEQMKGRGVRVINPTELSAVTPDAAAKTHFVIVDCVGMTESSLNDTQPLERKRSVPLGTLLEQVAAGCVEPEVISSVASRLARINAACGPVADRQIQQTTGGTSLRTIVQNLTNAIDPDRQVERAREEVGLDSEEAPTEEQIHCAAVTMAREAAQPLATNPDLRQLLLTFSARPEQIIDEISKDELLSAGASEEAREGARSLVESFESYLAENPDEITALQFFYSVPYRAGLRYRDIKALAEAINNPPRSWTPEKLWRAYEILEKDKVRGASGQRLLTDIVSLVRFALHQQDELVPFADQVQERFTNWMAQQENRGRVFTQEQVRWLEMIRDHIATSLEIDTSDFEYAPFAEEGGLGRAAQVFGPELRAVLRELNEVLAA